MSFKNANKRFKREHRERAQPRHRAKFGLLEKKKDYSARARNYNRKQKTLKRLREKAALKNPNEFYYKMQNSHLNKGKHVIHSKKKFELDDTKLKLFKTQDQVYLTMKRQMERNKITKLQAQLHHGADHGISTGDVDKQPGTRRSHIIFVDDEDEVREFADVDAYDNHSGLFDEEEEEEEKEKEEDTARRIASAERRSYEQLAARVKREKQLSALVKKIEKQKQVQGKGKKRKVGVDAAGIPVYRWAPRRRK